jgi:carbamoyltransferase
MVMEHQEYILGISAFYHDSAAVVTKGNRIIAAAQEERFSRRKHDPSFPHGAVAWCLEHTGLSLDRISMVVFYDKPFLKFERLLETYYAFAPRGLKSFLSAIPVWIKEKLMLKSLIKKELSSITGEPFPDELRVLFPEHHLSHAASAFYPSPFEEAAILTVDGVGEWATSTIGHGRGSSIRILKQLDFPHSVGLLYSAFTYYTGFRVNSGEYKLMGLAPYGNPHAERTKQYIDFIRSELTNIKEDGSIFLNMKYFDYATGLRMTKDELWEEMFGIPPRRPESEITQPYMDMAYAIQQVTEDVLMKMARHTKELTGADRLCLAGGVALNCVSNGKLLRSGLFDDIWIQPAAGDAGGALGAALAGWYIYRGNEDRVADGRDHMDGAYLGPEFGPADIERVARKYNSPYRHFEDFEELAKTVATLLAEGKVVGWFQGKMEWGPRALGNRSILGDARSPEMQKRLNLKIKFRESFRPFAPSVLWEDVADYFELDAPSPYMLLVADVEQGHRKPVPDRYHELPLKEKLYHLRSDIPAVTHLDYSARVQTVHRESNPRYWKLLHAFKEHTGYGVFVNTSFNVRGEPIVCSPEDAYVCFMRTDMDYLVMDTYLFDKSDQGEWHERENWREEHPLD